MSTPTPPPLPSIGPLGSARPGRRVGPVRRHRSSVGRRRRCGVVSPGSERCGARPGGGPPWCAHVRRRPCGWRRYCWLREVSAVTTGGPSGAEATRCQAGLNDDAVCVTCPSHGVFIGMASRGIPPIFIIECYDLLLYSSVSIVTLS